MSVGADSDDRGHDLCRGDDSQFDIADGFRAETLLSPV